MTSFKLRTELLYGSKINHRRKSVETNIRPDVRLQSLETTLEHGISCSIIVNVPVFEFTVIFYNELAGKRGRSTVL